MRLDTPTLTLLEGWLEEPEHERLEFKAARRQFDRNTVLRYSVALANEGGGRPVGTPLQLDGAYWMRRGEELTPMTQEALRSIFAEAQPDFSAEVCAGASLDHLDPTAVGVLRRR